MLGNDFSLQRQFNLINLTLALEHDIVFGCSFYKNDDNQRSWSVLGQWNWLNKQTQPTKKM